MKHSWSENERTLPQPRFVSRRVPGCRHAVAGLTRLRRHTPERGVFDAFSRGVSTVRQSVMGLLWMLACLPG
jgi:hypothetical protein